MLWFFVFWWIWVITIAVWVLYFPIFTMWNQLRFFLFSLFTTPIHRFLFGVEMFGCPFRIFSFRIPTTFFRVRYYVSFFTCHLFCYFVLLINSAISCAISSTVKFAVFLATLSAIDGE